MEPFLIITSVLLFLSLILLSVQLYRQQRVYNSNSRCGIFKQEILTLLGILAGFFLSYLLRIWWYYKFFNITKFWEQTWPSLLFTIPFDFLPLLLMMILHFRNFRVKKLKKNDEIANEIDEILHLNLLEVQTSGSVLLDARSSISERSLTRNRFSANCDKNENLERDIFFH
jgi:hypothetical protein